MISECDQLAKERQRYHMRVCCCCVFLSHLQLFISSSTFTLNLHERSVYISPAESVAGRLRVFCVAVGRAGLGDSDLENLSCGLVI